MSERDLHRYSYEAFATNPEIIEKVDLPVIRQIENPVHKAVDLGTGVGVVIEHLIREEKLISPYDARGIDIDKEALVIAEERLGKYAKQGDSIRLDYGNAEELGITPSTQELVTSLNMIHLTNARKVITESRRILVPGGLLIVSSGYEGPGEDDQYPRAYPDTKDFNMWGSLVAFSRIDLKRQGFTNFEEPTNRFIYTREDLRKFASSSGFSEVSTYDFAVELGPDPMKGICSYREFAHGALPGIPLDDAVGALTRSVDKVFARFGTDTFRRNWMVMLAEA